LPQIRLRVGLSRMRSLPKAEELDCTTTWECIERYDYRHDNVLYCVTIKCSYI
jgi:hypothetical protein